MICRPWKCDILPKKREKKKEMIQALWWKTLAGPDGASNYLHYQNKAITPSGQVRVPPQVIVLTSDPAGKKVAMLPWRRQLIGRMLIIGKTVRWESDDRGEGRREETAECRLEGSGLSQESRRGRNNFIAVFNQYWIKSAKITLKLIGWFIYFLKFCCQFKPTETLYPVCSRVNLGLSPLTASHF